MRRRDSRWSWLLLFRDNNGGSFQQGESERERHTRTRTHLHTSFIFSRIPSLFCRREKKRRRIKRTDVEEVKSELQELVDEDRFDEEEEAKARRAEGMARQRQRGPMYVPRGRGRGREGGREGGRVDGFAVYGLNRRLRSVVSPTHHLTLFPSFPPSLPPQPPTPQRGGRL